MELVGIYTNESKTITITFKSGGTYSLTGLKGFETERGRFWVEESRVAGYPYSLALKLSDRLEDHLSTGVYKLPIKLIDNKSFVVLDDYFCKRDFDDILQPTVFTKSPQSI